KRMSRSCTSDITSSALKGMAVLVMAWRTLLARDLASAYPRPRARALRTVGPGAHDCRLWDLAGRRLDVHHCGFVLDRLRPIHRADACRGHARACIRVRRLDLRLRPRREPALPPRQRPDLHPNWA